MTSRILWAAAAIAVVGVGIRVSAQEQPFRRELHPHAQIGRFQLASAGPVMFMIDTATGQVWKRNENGDWNDDGNPTKPKPASETEAKKSAALDLKGKSVEMVVVQREERAVPGSDGTVLIRVGDITDGQAFLTIVNADREELLPRTSVKQGDAVEFRLGAKHFSVKVNELRNILIGDDFAKLTVAEGKPVERSDVHETAPKK
jgi:hypothetical protein